MRSGNSQGDFEFSSIEDGDQTPDNCVQEPRVSALYIKQADRRPERSGFGFELFGVIRAGEQSKGSIPPQGARPHSREIGLA